MTRQDKERPPLIPSEMIPDRMIAPDNTIWIVPDHDSFANPKHFQKAGKTREWWSPYFYNCLPILFGNQHGFLMLSTHDFMVRWNGKNDLPDLEVTILDENADTNLLTLESHFGSGILTVQSRYVLRTPPGVNLLVKEPPNYFVHGFSWMNAVIESDNLRRDFTFNIKVTKPNIDIYVPKGTPVGCFLPYPRYFLDQYKLEELTDEVLLREAQKTIDFFALERDKHDKGIPRKRYMEGIDIFNTRFKHHQKSLDMGKWWHSGIERPEDRLPAASATRTGEADSADLVAEDDAVADNEPLPQTPVLAKSGTTMAASGLLDAYRSSLNEQTDATPQDAVKKCPVGFLVPKNTEKTAMQVNQHSHTVKADKDNGSNGNKKRGWWDSIWHKLAGRANGDEEDESEESEVGEPAEQFGGYYGNTAPVSFAVSNLGPAFVGQQSNQGQARALQEFTAAENPTQYAEEFKEIIELNAGLPNKTVTLFLPHDFDKAFIPQKADRLRNWWEQDKKTIDHARFCLPLTMASGVGWYILSRTTFTVEWDGDERHDAQIEIIDAASHAIIDNHSAHGSFTVQTRFVPRTKRPGDYIYIKGVANQYRLKYYLLEAMVEAWWSPGNFGMVCMMNGPGKVTVKKGEPFAQMFVINAEQCFYDLAVQDGYPQRWKEWDEKREPSKYNGRNLDYFKGLWPDGKQVCPHFKHWSKQPGGMSIEGVDDPIGDEKGKPYPLFEEATDGPLLDMAKTMEIDTDAGKIHVILDPELAPVTATQIHKLLKNGVFNGTPFVRYEPDFLVQTAIAEEKTGGRAPLTAKGKSMLRRLPLEVESQLNGSVKHKQGYLGMGRDDDPNSAVSSFSIFLGEAPHLNGKYTIFGRIVPNQLTLATLHKFSQQMPNVLPTINSAREI